MATYVSARLDIAKSSARDDPRATRALDRAASPNHTLQRYAQGIDVTRRDEHRIDPVGGDVAVAVEGARDDGGARRHRLDQHDPERFSVQRRGAEHGGAPHPGHLVGVGDAAEPVEAIVTAEFDPEPIRVRSGRLRSSTRRRSSVRRRARSSTSSPLRSSWRPRKKIAGRSCRRGGVDLISVVFDAIEQHLVVAAEVSLHQGQRVLRDDDLVIDAVQQAPQHRSESPIASTTDRRRGMCRPSAPCAASPW